MSAIRLARAYSRKNKIIKFEGCYHGHCDHFLVSSGSGALTLGIPNSPGIPQNTIQDTLVARFNDLESVEVLFKKYPSEVGAIILEPVAGNMNLLTPRKGFLEGLRKLCDQHGSLLIFDEVMTGFRVSLSGAQGLYNVLPDLTTLGKIIGGGMPVGAFGGKKEIMQMLAPDGCVYQAGTLSGNPLAMKAGIVTLDRITEDGFYLNLEKKTSLLINGLNRVSRQYSYPFMARYIGGMFGLYFTKIQKNVELFDDIKLSNIKEFNRFFHYMLNHGIYFAPSSFEAGFMSIVHSDDMIKQTVDTFEEYLNSFPNIS